MSVAAVANKEDKKPLYKDYVSFLGSYKQEKKDEGDKEGRCSPSTSIHSDLNDMPKKSFKEYLEKYNNKKYNPIQADFKKNSTQNGEGKIVKTEVFIEINNEPNPGRLITKTLDLNIKSPEISQDHNNSVKNITKAYMGNIETSVLQSKVNNELVQGKNNGEELSQKKIENKIPLSTEIRKHPLKKTPSISEKSKIFEKIPTNKTTGCKFDSVTKSSVAKHGCLPPKPVFNKGVASQMINNENHIKQNTAKNSVNPTVPVAKIQQNHFQPDISLPESSSTVSSQETAVSSSTSPQKNTSCGIPPPPPPPPATANFSPKRISLSPKPFSNAKTQPTIYNTMPKLQNTRQADTTDGNTAPALDKNDPRVKKMVYGALREMYGSYHDKANDYLATLPKNRVKKNNGLDSIINSIASQGGLEKLTGRGNPKAEIE